MRILVVCGSLRVNETSSGIVSSTFLKVLEQKATKLKVITLNDFTYPVTWLSDNTEVEKLDFRKSKRLYEYIPKLKGLLSYILKKPLAFYNMEVAYNNGIKKELESGEYDIIYFLGTGVSIVPYISILKGNIKIPIYVNLHDPFPMSKFPYPYKKEDNYLDTILSKQMDALLKKADKISLPSLYLKEFMGQFYSAINEKGFVIPHIGTHLANLPKKQGSENELSSIHIDSSKINIMHLGTLLNMRNPKFLLMAIAELNKDVPGFESNVNFTFIGKVLVANEDIASIDSIKNVSILTSRISYENSIELQKKADGLLIIEAISDFSPFLPGKFSDILNVEKPIIALSPEKSEVRRLLGPSYPFQSELDNFQKIKSVLLNFYSATINKDDSYKEKIIELKDYVSVSKNAEHIFSDFEKTIKKLN